MQAGSEGNSQGGPILRLEGITKNFGKNKVLKSVSCAIPRGSYFGIIGPNGAGKSTLLKIIIGFLKPTHGKIFLEGKNIVSRDIDIRHSFGYASQSNCFYQELTVNENLHYFGRLYWLTAQEIKKRSAELINLVGLRGHENIAAKYLSGGMQRKLDIACAIIHAPKILILDEPVAGLDPISTKHLWQILDHIHKIGTTIIVSSHILSDLENRCSNLILLNDGKIIKSGSPQQLISVPNIQEIIIEAYPQNYSDLMDDITPYNLMIESHKVINNKLVISTPEPERTLYYVLFHLAKKHQRLINIDFSKPSLADVFERFVKQESMISLMQKKNVNTKTIPPSK